MSTFGHHILYGAHKDELLYQISIQEPFKTAGSFNWLDHIVRHGTDGIALLSTGGDVGTEAAFIAAYVNGLLDNIEHIIVLDGSVPCQIEALNVFLSLSEDESIPIIYDGGHAAKIIRDADIDAVPEELTRQLHLLPADRCLVPHSMLCLESHGNRPNANMELRYRGTFEDWLIDEIGTYNVFKWRCLKTPSMLAYISINSCFSDFDLSIDPFESSYERNLNEFFLKATGFLDDRETAALMRSSDNVSILAKAAHAFSSRATLHSDETYLKIEEKARRVKELDDIFYSKLHPFFIEDRCDELLAMASEVWSEAADEVKNDGTEYSSMQELERMINIRSIVNAIGMNSVIDAYDSGVPAEAFID